MKSVNERVGVIDRQCQFCSCSAGNCQHCDHPGWSRLHNLIEIPVSPYVDYAETMRDQRLWTIGAILQTYLLYKNDVDPWSTRQALITALELDTEAALNRGIDYMDLVKFDAGARAEAKKLIDRLKM